MEILSVRDYRNNLAESFDRAAEGEQVLIRRKNTIYALVSVGSEHVTLSSAQQARIDELTGSIKRSWQQVQMMEEGKMPTKSALKFVDEL